jgi:hypothetical protein
MKPPKIISAQVIGDRTLLIDGESQQSLAMTIF